MVGREGRKLVGSGWEGTLPLGTESGVPREARGRLSAAAFAAPEGMEFGRCPL
jgi:hypothetical protein